MTIEELNRLLNTACEIITALEHYADEPLKKDIEALFNEIKYNHCLRIFRENKSNFDIIINDIELSLENFKNKEKDNKQLYNMYI